MVNRLLLFGDSKTIVAPWVATLTGAIVASTGDLWASNNGAVGGQSVAGAVAAVGDFLATCPDEADPNTYTDALMNWGANDGVAMGEATWAANYLAVIDAAHAKAPNARIFLMRPWRRGQDAIAATHHAWIDNIVAARAFTYVGPDEAVWLKGADDGATMTVDGIHYSAAGHAECAAQWQTVLGY